MQNVRDALSNQVVMLCKNVRDALPNQVVIVMQTANALINCEGCVIKCICYYYADRVLACACLFRCRDRVCNRIISIATCVSDLKTRLRCYTRHVIHAHAIETIHAITSMPCMLTQSRPSRSSPSNFVSPHDVRPHYDNTKHGECLLHFSSSWL